MRWPCPLTPLFPREFLGRGDIVLHRSAASPHGMKRDPVLVFSKQGQQIQRQSLAKAGIHNPRQCPEAGIGRALSGAALGGASA